MQVLPELQAVFGNYNTPKIEQDCSSTAYQIVASLYQQLIDKQSLIQNPKKPSSFQYPVKLKNQYPIAYAFKSEDGEKPKTNIQCLTDNKGRQEKTKNQYPKS